MICFAADENFSGRILRGFKRRLSGLDIVRIQDTDLRGAEDPTVLSWCADQQRVLLTHDVATMIGFAYERVDNGLPMPGVVEVSADLAIGRAIDELCLLAQAATVEDCVDQVLYLPF